MKEKIEEEPKANYLADVFEIGYAQYLAVVWNTNWEHIGNVYLEPIASPFNEDVRVRWALCSLYSRLENIGRRRQD